MKPKEQGKIFHFLTKISGVKQNILNSFSLSSVLLTNGYHLYMRNGEICFGRSIIGQLLTMLACVIWFPSKCFNCQQWVAYKLALNFSTLSMKCSFRYMSPSLTRFLWLQEKKILFSCSKRNKFRDNCVAERQGWCKCLELSPDGMAENVEWR